MKVPGHEQPLHILLLGAFPPPLGGTTVLLEQLREHLSRRDDVRVSVVNTSGANSWSEKALLAARTLGRLWRAVGEADVVTFHASRGGALAFGPVVRAVAAVRRKPWVFRKFGGGNAVWHASLPRYKQWILEHGSCHATELLFESKHDVSYFSRALNRCIHWYPNSRPVEATVNRKSSKHGGMFRFVFLGHVKPSKGVRELIGAAAGLPVEVDVFGPLQDGMEQHEFSGTNVRYRGVLQPASVFETLQGYDALVLPTYHAGEGYPGVILEAYAAGLPVIATRWQHLPEIVSNDSGILVEPRSVEDLRAAMQRLMNEPGLHTHLAAGAIQMAGQFDSQLWADWLVDLCRSLKERAS